MQNFFEKIVTADALLSNVDDYTDVSKALWESLKEIAGDSPLILWGMERSIRLMKAI